MDLRQMRYFIATAEELHFGRAAERVHIAQPALSLQIKALEADLGAELLIRNNRKVELTYAGEVLLAEARRIVSQVVQATEIVRMAGAGLIGTLKIGYSANAAYSGVMPIMIRRFRQAHPAVHIQLIDLHPNVQTQKLKAGEIDVAFLTVFHGEQDSELATSKLMEWPMVVALDAEHRLAGHASVTVEDLENEDFVVYSGLDERDGLRIIARATNLHPVVVHEAPNVIGLVNMVAAGLGIALVPASLKSIHAAGSVIYLPLEGISAKLELHVARFPENANPTLLGFFRAVSGDKA